MIDQGRLQAAARDYPYLRGLVAAPAGVLFVVAALGNWHWGPFRHDWVFIATLLVIGLVMLAAQRHYQQHYGRVTPAGRQQVKATAAGVIGIAIMVFGCLLLRSRASWSLDLPVNAIPTMFAAIMLIFYAAVVGLRAHHVVIWGALLVAGALPVWTAGDPSNIGLVLCGAAVAVNGVLDHRLMARAFAHGRG